MSGKTIMPISMSSAIKITPDLRSCIKRSSYPPKHALVAADHSFGARNGAMTGLLSDIVLIGAEVCVVGLSLGQRILNKNKIMITVLQFINVELIISNL